MSEKIAFFGGRGLTSNYGGVENAIREIATRMVNNYGYQVDVYGHGLSNRMTRVECRQDLFSISAPKWASRLGGNALVPILCALYAVLFRRPQTAVIFASGPCTTALIFRLFRIHTVCGLRAIDSQRDKWGWMSKTVLRTGEYCATHVADVCTVNSKEMEDYYRARGNAVVYIPNGATQCDSGSDEVLRTYGLKANKYLLFAARLDPAKRLHLLLQAYRSLSEELKIPLVIAGGYCKSKRYYEHLQSLTSPGVKFLGHLDKEAVDPLMRNCYAFVHPSVLEGMSNSLLAAMSTARPIICADIKANKDVVHDNEFALFKADDLDALKLKLAHLLAHPDTAREQGETLQRHAQHHYDWNTTTRAYSDLIKQLSARYAQNALHEED